MNRHSLLASLPILALTAACGCLGGFGCGNSADRSHTPPDAGDNAPATVRYTCPMHADVVANAPGKCPKCGMALVVKQ